jgi:23S rRNA (adenine2030-N6)-methyltransferase
MQTRALQCGPRRCSTVPAAVLAYRHAFHSGSHADVLKHLVLAQVLRYMADKDKPFTLIDTHAGAGGYSLEGRYARKRAEFEHGIARLWGRDDLPAPLADYVALVKQFNDGGKLRQYPGSPGFAQMLLRPDDRLRLYELHPTDHRILAAYLGRHPNTQVAQGDGFAALKGELPPPSRRGVVLIDPSYEIKTDYARVVAAVREALTRFADAVVIVWYPQLLTLESSQLPQRLQSAAEAHGKRGWLHARLTVQQADAQGFGMIGSGLFVANPPFVLHGSLRETLPFLVEVLGEYAGANFLLEQRAA